MDPPTGPTQVEEEQFRQLPFAQQWGFLKSRFEQLYLIDNRRLDDIAKIMKEQWNFDANGSQYKYQFNKKWGWKKNVPASTKANIVQKGQKRASMGKSTVAMYKGNRIDSKKLRRHAKEISRREGAGTFVAKGQAEQIFDDPETQITSVLPHKDTVFAKWTLPYQSMRSAFRFAADYPSPLGPTVSTPMDVDIKTPSATDLASPNNAPSPLTTDLMRITAIDRARLFISGQHEELLKCLNKHERKFAITYLHDFWLFAFRTAKYWGYGPKIWNAESLGLKLTSHRSPSDPVDAGAVAGVTRHSPHLPASQQVPSDLCCWSIHVGKMPDYEPVVSPPREESPDPNDKATWEPWPETGISPSYEARLAENLETSDFTNLATANLVLATKHLAQAAKGSRDQMVKESLMFSIMSGNAHLTERLLDENYEMHAQLAAIHPLHLAASYLQGSKECCNLLFHIGNHLARELRRDDTNSNGHTVLDCLMVVILKAHSNCNPSEIDDSLRGQVCFLGEEVDVCGRWQADSDCYRELLANGASRVPSSWKHKFCHTSVQAITHCIAILPDFVDLNIPSGLFTKRCTNCGMKLQLTCLHTLVLVGWKLGLHGCQNEDLFGIIACTLALIRSGVDARKTAHISLAAWGDSFESDACDHIEMTAFELAIKLSDFISHTHAKTTHTGDTGWRIICHLLHRSECVAEREDGLNRPSLTQRHQHLVDSVSLGGYSAVCWDDCYDIRFGVPLPFSEDKYLGHIWAAVQTELLNYRRLAHEDPWVSKRLNLDDILQSLDNDYPLSIEYISSGMINPYCVCGNFSIDERNKHIARPPARRENVSAEYFSNLDDWRRTSFIGTASAGDWW